MVCRNKWVDVAFVQGEEYSKIADMGIQEMSEYLAQWDYGTETDAAHTKHFKPWGSLDRTYNVTVNGTGVDGYGTDYVLAINSALGYASLNRRPLQ